MGLYETLIDHNGEKVRVLVCNMTDAPTTEAAGLDCIEPRMPAVGVGLWRGGNWALHAGIVLGSACTCDHIKTVGARAVGGHSCVRRGLAGMLLALHTATRASRCACALSSLSCVFVFSGRVCCLWHRCAVGNEYHSAGNACSGMAVCVGACSLLHA